MTDAQAGGGTAAGRATVAADTSEGAAPTQGGATTYTRPPGMAAPPTSPDQIGGRSGAPEGPARVADAVRAARAAVSAAAGRGPRRARLHLKRVEPWSVMKFSFAVSIVLFIVMIVATTVLYIALDAMGVFDSVNELLVSLVGGGGGSDEPFQLTAKGVILVSALLGLVNMVLFTALSTLGAFIYNVCADLVGGIEVTLAEKE
ncbi:hypothetical protein Snas_0008 [Stackebrandtia nassauensis DSM 44728]|uniref:DUF3566 domain-containing protein n=1 Tax=Stackebrandtia nassauensis (strain DSM 44728 / CIP 108903 / NRRL B-16338 / NBRC 102104 / LLR-40K-21) TaxID=446470 RepID=D3PTX3_STANL|nr:DUF3566 domain-containing protein [Stackebrandtia nassauensis]ADD39731.1 hypothetical protein Snas_0008 [Stackebrandtia nassauensis DSM 44728]